MDRRKRLERLMKLGELRHGEVARQAGCSRPYVSLMVTGRRRVTDQVLAATEKLARKRAKELLRL